MRNPSTPFAIFLKIWKLLVIAFGKYRTSRGCLCTFYATQANFPNHAPIVHTVGNHHGRAGGSEEVEQEGDEELEQRGREAGKEQLPPTREGKGQEEEETFCFGQNVFAQTETEMTFKLIY